MLDLAGNKKTKGRSSSKLRPQRCGSTSTTDDALEDEEIVGHIFTPLKLCTSCPSKDEPRQFQSIVPLNPRIAESIGIGENRRLRHPFGKVVDPREADVGQGVLPWPNQLAQVAPIALLCPILIVPDDQSHVRPPLEITEYLLSLYHNHIFPTSTIFYQIL